MASSNPKLPPPDRNTLWQDDHGQVRVMGIVEGYVVVRRKGCAPFLQSVRDFYATFSPAEA